MTTHDHSISIARAYYWAYVAKDRRALEALLADDFCFTSPLDNRISRATYFERCWPNSQKIKTFDLVNLVVDGARVIVTYEGRTSGDRRFRNTEILTLEGDKVVDVEVYFGWLVPHKAAPGGYIDNPTAEMKQSAGAQ